MNTPNGLAPKLSHVHQFTGPWHPLQSDVSVVLWFLTQFPVSNVGYMSSTDPRERRDPSLLTGGIWHGKGLLG